MLTNRLADELGGVAADLRHRTLAFEPEAFLARNLEFHDRLAYVIEGELAVEQPDERPDGAGGVVVLGLAQQKRAAALDVAQIDVVAQRGAEDAPSTIYRENDLGLRVVPCRVRTHAYPVAPAHRRQCRRLGEDLGVGPDGHLEVLRPEAVGDQRLLELLRLLGAGLHRTDVGTDALAQTVAQTLRLAGVAAATLLD